MIVANSVQWEVQHSDFESRSWCVSQFQKHPIFGLKITNSSASSWHNSESTAWTQIASRCALDKCAMHTHVWYAGNIERMLWREEAADILEDTTDYQACKGNDSLQVGNSACDYPAAEILLEECLLKPLRHSVSIPYFALINHNSSGNLNVVWKCWYQHGSYIIVTHYLLFKTIIIHWINTYDP